MLEIKFSFSASLSWLKEIRILILLIIGKERKASPKRSGNAKVWRRSGVYVLTISRFELQEWCFFRPIFTALLDALHFAPEVLHGGAVHRGLRVGASEYWRTCWHWLIGKHPVNSSAARKRFSEKRQRWKLKIFYFSNMRTGRATRVSNVAVPGRPGTRRWKQSAQFWWSSWFLLLRKVMTGDLFSSNSLSL